MIQEKSYFLVPENSNLSDCLNGRAGSLSLILSISYDFAEYQVRKYIDGLDINLDVYQKIKIK